jgi:hypothetical protein
VRPLLFALFSLALSTQAQPPGATEKLNALLNGEGPIELALEAPLHELFQIGLLDEKVSVPGTLRLKKSDGALAELTGVEVSVRGNTSRRETECTFPKLKVKHPQAGTLKIGTHCGEKPDEQLSPKYGRLSNERSPQREALVYELLQVVEAPTLKTRPARITYIDKAASEPIARHALLLEDDEAAMKRMNGTAEIPLESFGSVATRGAGSYAARIAFAQAMIGNFDWCLKFSPDDIYRCNEPRPLWNVVAFDIGGNKASLLMKDFDLAGMVVGTHPWFDKVWNRKFVQSGSATEIEVLSQVQRTRSLFPRAQLDAERQHFISKKSALYQKAQTAPVDDRGRALAKQYLDAFFQAIEDDAAFYRPIVAADNVQVFTDAEGTREACGPKDVMRPGTPVNEIQKSGPMSQVVILDAMWRWASKNECNAVQDGPVWIRSDAITTNYPSKN